MELPIAILPRVRKVHREDATRQAALLTSQILSAYSTAVDRNKVSFPAFVRMLGLDDSPTPEHPRAKTMTKEAIFAGADKAADRLIQARKKQIKEKSHGSI